MHAASFGNRVVADVVKDLEMISSFQDERRRFEIQRTPWGRQAQTEEWVRVMCVEGQEHQGFQQLLEAGERHRARCPSESPEGTHSAKIVESELLASTMARECFSVVLSHPLCGNTLLWIRELIYYSNYTWLDPGPGCFTD